MSTTVKIALLGDYIAHVQSHLRIPGIFNQLADELAVVNRVSKPSVFHGNAVSARTQPKTTSSDNPGFCSCGCSKS